MTTSASHPVSTALARTSPSEEGVDARGISAFLDAVDTAPGVELHSLMVLRHGRVVTEGWWTPYTAERQHLLYSLSKSFTSTALGFAVGEGLVDLDATVLSYFPELDHEVSDPRSRSIRVRHVAAMASGHREDTWSRAVDDETGNPVRGFLRLPPEEEPGSIFAYNQSCTFSLAAIVQRVSGTSLTEFLRPRLFEPLGIGTVGWETLRGGLQIGFSGLYVPTEAIAKLGQLYLQDGVWNGRRLLPEGWVAEATQVQIATPPSEPDWVQGYGFQFWRSRHGYRGDGAYGQFCLVLPEVDAVVAITSQSADMQALLEAVWDHLLPAFSNGATDAGADAELVARLGSVTLAAPQSSGARPDLAAMTFQPLAGSEPYSLASVELRAAGSGWDVVLNDGDSPLTVALDPTSRWQVTGALATASAFVDGDLQLDVVFVETPHRLHLVLDLAGATFRSRWETAPLQAFPLAEHRMPLE